MTGEPAFFELGVADDDKGRAFYSSLFGWDFRPGPNEGYEIGTAGLPGGIHGGDKGAAPYLFFAVDDMGAAAARVVELGGEVIDMDIEGEPASRPRPGASSSAATTRGRRSACTSAPRRSERGRRAAYAAAAALLSCHGVRILGPCAVMAIVNSKWAASEPSWE